MNQLKEIIHNNYCKLPKSRVLQITLDVCYQQMQKVTRQDVSGWDKDTALLNMQKVDWYSKVNEGLLEFLKEEKDLEKISKAKEAIIFLIKIMENETLEDLENGGTAVQERIINDTITPHYLIEWSLNNLLDEEVKTTENKDVIEINGVKWANCNLGSSKPTDFGEYYTWGAAKLACSRGWRLPTEKELKSLISAGSIWTTINGVAGRLFGTSPNQIFLPAAGYCWNDSTFKKVGTDGKYWSSTDEYGKGTLAYIIYFNSSSIDTNNGNTAHGRTVRCVID